MYLKRLEIQGFKSFANKTILDFLPPRDGRFSITGVVGPNGSGKSNVTDAIRWVMGETSLKVIRGKKSEDVIFSGSDAKGQLSAAEVTMVLDNSDGKVELDYPEIIITRRIFRNGESEYLINHNPVRLLDIHLILAKAQFAEHSYSIVGQGMIDKLLIVGPAERKEFLDEASGIKEFQIKQHQATLKLTRTRDNMEQAERLLQEVEPRLKILARQVKKLEQRQEVETQLRAAQEKYYVTLYKRNLEEIAVIDGQLKVVETNYRNSFYELETIQTELSELAKSESRQEVFVALQSKHQEAVREKNEWERQLAITDGRMQAQYQEAGKGNVGWIENKLKELKNKRDEIVAALKSAEAEVEKVQQRVTDKKKIIENLSVEKTEKTVRISRLQSAFLQNQSEQNYFQFVGLSAVKAVLDAKNKFGGKVHGIVAELAEVSDEYRLAVDTAAASSLASIVVEDDETGRHAIEYLRYNKLGVATFLPLNKIHARFVSDDLRSVIGESGVVGLAIELLKFNPRFEPIFSHILGDTLVVRDLSVAQRLGVGRFRMVTLDGDIVERHGVMKGGWRGKDRNLSFATKVSLTTEEKLREYQLQINTEQQKMVELETLLEKNKGELLTLEVESQTAQHRCGLHTDERQSLDREINGLDRELSFTQITPEQYGALMVQLSQEKSMMNKQLAAAQKRVEEVGVEIADFNRKEEEKKQRVFDLQSRMQTKQNEVNNILNSRNDLKVQSAKLETKQEDLLTEAQNEIGEPLVGVVDRNPETVSLDILPSIADSVQKLKYQLSLIGGIDADVTVEYNTTKERYDFLSGQIDDLKNATEDLSKMIEELDEIMKTKRGAAFKKIRKEFDRYFKILFGGGSADLTELYGEPEEELVEGAPTEGQPVNNEAELSGEEQPKKKKSEKVLYGIDIAANPPGKKIKHLNALSGGERTLTSIALICAILNNNPSPFVVLDEVEAALDEANTQRFVKIMGELSTRSQFIVITHNRVTMHASDALYGVTMASDGISKLLSVKLEEVKVEK